VVANLSLHSKQLELGKDVLRYSNPDRNMTLSRPPENWKWDPVRISTHCLSNNLYVHCTWKYQKSMKYGRFFGMEETLKVGVD